MVKEITKKEEPLVVELCNNDPLTNCYILSDTTHLGVDHPSIKMYGDIIDGALVSVLMMFNRYGILYSSKDTISLEYVDIIKKIKPFSISGDKHSMEQLMKHIEYQEHDEYKFAVLEKHKADEVSLNSFSIREINENEQLKVLYDLLKNISEFNVSSLSEQEFIEEKKLIHLAGTTYGLYDETNHLLSTATVMSETDRYAVINGVATNKDHRNCGLATILIDYVIDQFINKKNKWLILYYNQPAAASIYLRKGFVNFGEWVSIKL